MSSIFASDVELAQSVKTIGLRDLDAFEELFWLFEQSVPVFHVIVAEVSGRTTIRQWRDALEAIQIRYPLLSASIRKVPGKRPFFEKTRGASMPLRIASLTDSVVLEEQMEKEFQKSFGDGSGPLTRATLFHSPCRSVVMFSTHHSSMDGKSHLLLIQDLLAALAGKKIGDPLEVQPGLGQLLGMPAPAEYVKKLEGRSTAPEEEQSAKLPKVRVQRLQLDEEETEILRQRAREEGTTVHSALVAALTLAGKRYSQAWNVGPVRCLSPIDQRKMLNIQDAAGLLITSHRAPVLTPIEASLWDIARSVREEMLSAQCAVGAQNFLGALSTLVSEEHNAQDLYCHCSSPEGPMVNELMVTNYAGYKARTEYGDLKIENLFTGSPTLLSTLQKVSVLTVNGKLGMTLVARDLFPTLLEEAREILTSVEVLRTT